MSKQTKTAAYINLSHFYFAKVSEGPNLEYTSEAPERIIGAMKMKTKPEISEGKLYGDGVIRESVSKKNGYLIDLEMNALPPHVRSYIEGTTISAGGIESGTSKDRPGLFAFGSMKERSDGSKDMIWYPFCQAQPIEEDVEQSDDKTNFSTPKITILAMEQENVGRFYSRCDTLVEANKEVTPELFFSQVQITDTPVQAAV